MIAAERAYTLTAVGSAGSIGDHDDIEGSGLLSIPMTMLSWVEHFPTFAAIAFKAFEDTSQHVEAIRSFICGRSF
jgi:hypothetical protein